MYSVNEITLELLNFNSGILKGIHGIEIATVKSKPISKFKLKKKSPKSFNLNLKNLKFKF